MTKIPFRMDVQVYLVLPTLTSEYQGTVKITLRKLPHVTGHVLGLA